MTLKYIGSYSSYESISQYHKHSHSYILCFSFGQHRDIQLSVFSSRTVKMSSKDLYTH